MTVYERKVNLLLNVSQANREREKEREREEVLFHNNHHVQLEAFAYFLSSPSFSVSLSLFSLFSFFISFIFYLHHFTSVNTQGDLKI